MTVIDVKNDVAFDLDNYSKDCVTTGYTQRPLASD